MLLRYVDTLRQQLTTLCALYGYEPVDTELVDDAELFLTSASAAVVPQLYVFERRGKPYVLRPEFTAAAMKRYLSLGIQKPTRWQFFGSIFQKRSNMPYPARSLSLGVEFIQADGLSADLEVLELALEISALLTSQPLLVSLSHMGFVQAVLSAFELHPFVIRLLISQPEQAAQLLTETDQVISEEADFEITGNMLGVILESTQYNRTMGGRNHRDITSRLLRKHSRNRQADQLRRAFDVIQEWNQTSITIDNLSHLRRYTHNNPAADKHLDYLFRLCEVLSAFQKQHTVHIRLSNTANWQYYTGLMFVVSNLSSVLISGGRYNDLSLTMGASVGIPAVGFSCSLDSFMQHNETPLPPLVRLQAGSHAEYRETAKRLRDHGIAVIPADGSNDVVRLMPDGSFTLGSRVFTTLNSLLDYLKGVS
jgi:ATP phosphoribosyltransferase regulatory subunit HisZ